MPTDSGRDGDQQPPVPLLAEASRLFQDGNDADAELACARAIAAWPDLRDALRLQLAIAQRRNDRAAILHALEALCRFDAADRDSLFELTRLLFETGAIERVAFLLHPHVLRGDEPDGVTHRYALALAHSGAWPWLQALRATLQMRDTTRPVPAPVLASLASGVLASATDPDRFRQTARMLEETPRWLDARASQSLLGEAIAASRPFSLLRLGAASAAFAVSGAPTASRDLLPSERRALLDDAWREQFGTDAPEHNDPAVLALHQEFGQAIAQADLVALPDASAIEADRARFGLLAAMHRTVRFQTDALFAAEDVTTQMHRAVPYLRTMLAGLPFLGFVGAHPAMVRKLAHFCGIPEVAQVPVPREARFPVAEDGIDPRGFLPDGHAATMRALSVPFRGAVFLVSAPAPLGSVYAGRIKALGGIAIEIGPLAAQWAGG